MGRPQAERGHGAERSPTATLDAPETCIGNDGIGRPQGPAYTRSFPPLGLISHPLVGLLDLSVSGSIRQLQALGSSTAAISALREEAPRSTRPDHAKISSRNTKSGLSYP